MSLGCWRRRFRRGRGRVGVRLGRLRRVEGTGGGFCVGFEGRSRGSWGDEILHVWVDGIRQEGGQKVRAVRGSLETRVRDWGGVPSLGVWKLLQSLDDGGGVGLCNPGKPPMEGDDLPWELRAFRIPDVVGVGQGFRYQRIRVDETAAVYGPCRPYVVSPAPSHV